MKKILLGLAVCLPLIFISLFWLAFLSERPPLTTDLATLAGDGSTLALMGGSSDEGPLADL